MISELEEIRRGNTFSRQKMPEYSFIYLLYKTLFQQKEFTLDISLLISNLEVSNSIKHILTKYIEKLPEGFELEDFHRYKESSLKKYFALFKKQSFSRHNEMQTPERMSLLALNLLNPQNTDTLADFYGAPEGFLRTLLDNKKYNYIFSSKPNAFTTDEATADFLTLWEDVLYIEEKQICITAKNILDDETQTFDRIFAFIPVFQKSNQEETKRLSQNIIFSEDESYKYVVNVINHLTEKGKAVICISDVLYSARTEELRKYICTCGYFKGLIRFPRGEIYPKNLPSTLLFFDRQNTSDEVTFLDFTDTEPQKMESIGISEILQSFSPERFSYLESPQMFFENGAKREIFTIFQLSQNNYDIDKSDHAFMENWHNDSKEYYSDEGLELTTKENELIVSENSGQFFQEFPPSKNISINNLVTIFRGIQDTEKINAFKTRNENAPFMYLCVSDIEDGSIQVKTMQRLSDKTYSWDKYFLESGDVIISKTAYPAFKIAIYEGENARIIPASNLYVIRINKANRNKLNPYYIKLYLESENGLKYLKSVSKGARLPAVSKENLLALTLPFKSEQEQKELEQKYKELQTKKQMLLSEIDFVSSQLKTLI